MARPLLASEIDALMVHLGGSWSLYEQRLSKTYEFPSFLEALRFVGGVGERAQEMNHHPKITIDYTKVTLELETHSQHCLTELDAALAERADKIFRDL